MQPLRLFVFFLLFVVHTFAADEITPSQTVNIPMQDGTLLPTDIYLPKKSERVPCVLIRSPAGRHAATAKEFLHLVDSGYVVAIQETRSALDKEGKTLPYLSDGWCTQQDGFDTVEWLGRSEFSNGCVGTVGASAMGITQMLMAPSAPPCLKCQYISMAAASLYHDALFPGGQLLKNQVEGWLGIFARDPSVREFVCNQPDHNEFWSKLDTRTMANKVKTPALHYGGWYDIFVQGTLDAFTSRQEKGSRGAFGMQKLVIGPWTHNWPKKTVLGDFEVPLHGQKLPIDASVKDWLDYHLKGTVNKIKDLPPVMYYVMGPFDGSSSSGNVWKFAEKWPVPATETALYLTVKGSIEENRPEQNAQLSFVYNPHNLVPTIGGRNLFLESGPKDQRPIEDRRDVLVFTSEPVAEDLEITGRVIADLSVSSDQPEMDFCVRLCDVYPDGKSILVSDGLSHKTFSPSQLEKEIRKVSVDLWSTSIVIAKGHRIRVSISSSNYPKHEKNNSPFATNAIFLGGANNSSITLPIIKR